MLMMVPTFGSWAIQLYDHMYFTTGLQIDLKYTQFEISSHEI